MDFKEGDILAGKYRIEKVLGAGGMGMVVAATHIQLDERVALKFLLEGALYSEEALARFTREARAAVKIKSEHVARVSDVGTLENGAPYMVMEHLTGTDLAVRLTQLGRLDVAEAAELLLQACEALAEAHSLGIVHRDLKPANLFLTHRPDGSICLKILDFGISKMAGPELGMTKTSAVLGSPLYMSPEQMTSSRDVDPRSDIWAIGVILYELLSGQVPFEGETIGHLCGLILTAQPRPFLDIRPDLSPQLQQVIFRCLEKERDRRYQNVGELAAALALFAPPSSGRSVERISRLLGVTGSLQSPVGKTALMPGLAPALGADSGAVVAHSTNASWGQTSPAAPKRAGWMLPLVAVLALGGIAAGVGLYVKGGGSSGPTPPEAATQAPALPVELPKPVASAPVEVAKDPSPALAEQPAAPAAASASAAAVPLASSTALEKSAAKLPPRAAARNAPAPPKAVPVTPPPASPPAPAPRPAANPLDGRF